jgi:uncharacterized protein YceK
MMRGFVICVVALLLVGCPAFDSYVTPKDPSAYPCGYFGTSCYSFDASRSCCPEHYRCVQLDPGCEYSGNPDVPPDELMGARKSGPPRTVPRMSEAP